MKKTYVRKMGSETIIYGDNIIGKYFQIVYRVTIRGNSKIANHVRIGALSDVQGNYVNYIVMYLLHQRAA